MGDNQTGYISNNSDAITFEYKNEHGELVTDPNLEVISFGYRADGSLKWLDVFDTSQNKVTRYNACVMEDIVYIHWGGQYVWTDINCHRLEVGGAEYEELVDTVNELDTNALRKQNNLNDVANKQTSLGNLESSAATPASAADYGYDTTTQQSKSNVQVQTTWGGGVPMAVPFKDFAETIIDAVGDPLPISKGGTNAQNETDAITNLLGSNTDSVIDNAVRDDGVLPYRCDSAYSQGHNVGKVSLLQMWNWAKNTKGAATLEDVNSITAKYITSSAAGNAFANVAALSGNKYYAGQIITTSTSPALGNNDYCIVLDSGAEHQNVSARYVYQNGSWIFQYKVSQMTLTQAQLDALNSGITASKVNNYDAYSTNKLGVNNNLSDLQSTDDAIQNLIRNAQTSGILTTNAKFPIYNSGIPASNAAGSATIQDLWSFILNTLIKTVSATVSASITTVQHITLTVATSYRALLYYSVSWSGGGKDFTITPIKTVTSTTQTVFYVDVTANSSGGGSSNATLYAHYI